MRRNKWAFYHLNWDSKLSFLISCIFFIHFCTRTRAHEVLCLQASLIYSRAICIQLFAREKEKRAGYPSSDDIFDRLKYLKDVSLELVFVGEVSWVSLFQTKGCAALFHGSSGRPMEKCHAIVKHLMLHRSTEKRWSPSDNVFRSSLLRSPGEISLPSRRSIFLVAYIYFPHECLIAPHTYNKVTRMPN